MSDGAKRVIAAIVILALVIFGAYMIASANATQPDSEEAVARLQTISQEIIANKAITKQYDGVSTELSFKDKTTTVVVSANNTKITTNLDSEWNIMDKTVKDLSTSFGSIMFPVMLLGILLGMLLWLFVCSLMDC